MIKAITGINCLSTVTLQKGLNYLDVVLNEYFHELLFALSRHLPPLYRACITYKTVGNHIYYAIVLPYMPDSQFLYICQTTSLLLSLLSYCHTMLTEHQFLEVLIVESYAHDSGPSTMLISIVGRL